MFITIWNGLKAAWKWLLDNPIAVAATLGAVLGAYLMWKSRKNKIASLEDAVEVQTTLRKVAKDEARAKLLAEQADAVQPEAEALRAQIQLRKLKIAEIRTGESMEGKSDEEIARMLTDAGL
jgi:cell division protein FtsX